MGLDSFWHNDAWLDEEGECIEGYPPTPFEDINLVGGIFSGSGGGSFRGKVYDEFIVAISDISLYQEEISNEEVTNIADILEEMTWMEAKMYHSEDHRFNHPETEKEFEDLCRMFRFYADEGCVLHGWW